MTGDVAGLALVAAPLATGIAVGLVGGGRSLVATLLAAYLVTWGCVITTVTALSPFRLVERAPVALVELLVATAAVLVWFAAGRPLPPRATAAAVLRTSPAVRVLGVVVVAGLVYAAWLVWELAPNNYDSMTYHLPRAAQWLQLGGVDWIANAPTGRQNVFPPGAEIGVLHLMLAFSSDRLVEVPQLVASVALAVAVFGVARRLGASASQAALAGLLFSTFSVTALQATTTQNDLVVASFVVAAAYFLLSDVRAAPVLAGLASALALGTKLTALFALPILVLLALTGESRRRSVASGAAFLVFSLPLVAPFAVRNLIETGRLVGGDGVDEQRAALTPGDIVSTLTRVGYRMLDLSGYASSTPALMLVAVAIAILAAYVLRPARLSRAWLDAALVLAAPLVVGLGAIASGRVLLHLGLDTPFGGWQPNRRADEDISYFGPLGATLLVPACAIVLARGRRRDPAAWVLALSLPVFALGLALAYEFNPWWGRFLLVPAALAAPLLPTVLSRPGVAAGAVVVGAVTLLLADTHNRYKPSGIPDGTPSWELSRYQVFALTSPGDNEASTRAYEQADRLLPPAGRVGALFGSNDPIYPLWNAGLDREIVYLPAKRSAQAAVSRGLAAIVIGPSASRTGFPSCAWHRRPLGAGWTLLTRRSLAESCQ